MSRENPEREAQRFSKLLRVYRDTSLEAFLASIPKRAVAQAKVLKIIGANGANGATTDEIEAATGMLHQSASATVSRLNAHDVLIDSGLRRKTRHGHNAIVWILPPKAPL